MKNTNVKLSLTVIAASMLAAYGTARAADESELSELTKPSSSVSVGVGAWDTERPQGGIYDGMRNNDTKVTLDADIQKRDDETGTWTTLSARNLGLDNQDLRAEFLKQGNWGVAFEFDQTESHAPYRINSNNLGIGTVSQVRGTNILNTAIGSGNDFHFGTRREKLGLSGYRNLMENLDLRIKFSSEDKFGERINTSSTSTFLADLIDWRTDKLEAVLDYAGERLQLSGGYNGSLFRNNNDLGFLTQNSGGTITRVTQPLDNEAHQVFLNGGYGFTPSTRGTFKLAYTVATQDENLPTAFLATPANTYGRLPNLNGEVETTLVQLGLTSRPISRLNVVANLRYYDVNDNTERFTTVPRADGVAGTINLNTTPYSYRTLSGQLEGTYDLSRGYSATAGVDLSEQDRTLHNTTYVPLRAKVDETTYRLQLRKTLSETLNGSLAYSFSDREGSDYTLSGGNVAERTGTSLVSPLNSGDRERQKVRLTLDWAPTEKVGVQVALESSEDEYGNAERSHGLHEGKANLYSLDLSYQLSEDWQAVGWYSYNTNDAHFINRPSPLAITANTNELHKEQNDIGEAVGLSLNGKLTAKTRVGAEISWSKDVTEFVQSNTNGTALDGNLSLAGIQPVVAPEISSRLTRIKLFANYSLQKNSDVRLDLAHEQWKTNDWLWNFQDGRAFQYGAAATDGTAVITTPKYNSTFVGLRFTQRFQ